MILKNHIAYRFLNDSNLWMEMIETNNPDIYTHYENKKDLPDSVHSLYSCLCSKNNKSYLVTESVLENLDMLKITKNGEHYNWSVFNNLPEQKVTFILPNNILLRMVVTEDTLWFCHLKFTFEEGSKTHGQSYWIMYYIDRKTGELCEHFQHPDVKEIEPTVYKFLCFFYLAENTEEILNPGKTYGTRRTGKILNDIGIPLTVVTSKWNTTVIRTEAFGVRGHFRVQPCGKGRTNYELIFIEPFVKNGYKRTAGKLLN